MKNLVIYKLILILSLFISSCMKAKNKDGLKILKENKYNFSNFKEFYHQGIYFYVPDYFVQDYNTDYLVKNDGLSLSNFDAGLYISCEKFDSNEAADFKFLFDKKLSNKQAIHNYYISQRENSLKNIKLSILHERKNKYNLSGYYQIIEGKKNSSYSYTPEMIYMISTFEKEMKGKKHYFVFQLIGSKEMASYLVDDFKRMMNSFR
jgi:hypothetical protein